MCVPLSAARQDPSGYEKCVSMCQKSIENLVSLLEEEEAAEARRRPKVINTILYLLYLYLLYLYLHISLLLTIPGGEAARPDHLYHHQPQPGNFILLQT